MNTLNDEYWPSLEWRQADPDSVGIRPELLSALEGEIKTRFRGINACLLIRKGFIVFEKYLNGFGPDDTHLVASVTKSFISALTGIAIHQGYLQGIHQRVMAFFPEYAPSVSDHLKSQITLEHLLTMTAGFQWRTGARNRELQINRLRRSKDWVAFILNLPVRQRFFGTFQYNSAASHLLSAIITRSTGSCAQDFATEYLFQPLGINPPARDMEHGYSQEEVFRNVGGGWPKDPQGNNIGGWGLVLKPRDMARFGYLYLSSGRWDGVQIIPEKWIEDSISPHTPGYGYQWWLRDVASAFVFSAVGQGGNHIFCIPQAELVFVVASKPASKWRDRWSLLEEFIIPAVMDLS